MELETLKKVYEKIKDIDILLYKIECVEKREIYIKRIKDLKEEITFLDSIDGTLSVENYKCILTLEGEETFIKEKVEEYMKGAIVRIGEYVVLKKSLIPIVEHENFITSPFDCNEILRSLKCIKGVFENSDKYFILSEGEKKDLQRNIGEVASVDYRTFFSEKNRFTITLSNCIHSIIKREFLSSEYDTQVLKSLNDTYFKGTPFNIKDTNELCIDIIMKSLIEDIKGDLNLEERHIVNSTQCKKVSQCIVPLYKKLQFLRDSETSRREKVSGVCRRILRKYFNPERIHSGHLIDYFILYSDVLYLRENNIVDSEAVSLLQSKLKKELGKVYDFHSILEESELKIYEQVEQYTSVHKDLSSRIFKEETFLHFLYEIHLVEGMVDFIREHNVSTRRSEYLSICEYIKNTLHDRSTPKYKELLSIIRILSSTVEEIVDILEEDGFHLSNMDAKIIIRNIHGSK